MHPPRMSMEYKENMEDMKEGTKEDQTTGNVTRIIVMNMIILSNNMDEGDSIMEENFVCMDKTYTQCSTHVQNPEIQKIVIKRRQHSKMI